MKVNDGLKDWLGRVPGRNGRDKALSVGVSYNTWYRWWRGEVRPSPLAMQRIRRVIMEEQRNNPPERPSHSGALASSLNESKFKLAAPAAPSPAAARGVKRDRDDLPP